MRYIFAGDREISVRILNFLIDSGYKPLAIIVSDKKRASHADELITLSELPPDKVVMGNACNEKETITRFNALQPDYVIGIHFPYIIKKDLLNIPKIGFLNLHPAYLPFNKGWHTPSWAILDKTPYGATLHYMAEELDSGDIIYQRKIAISPDDTANSLYHKVLQLEYDVFTEALPLLTSLKPPRIKQDSIGTSRKKSDLKEIQELNSEELLTIDKLRALTTNDIEEAAYFEEGGQRYYVRVNIEKG